MTDRNRPSEIDLDVSVGALTGSLSTTLRTWTALTEGALSIAEATTWATTNDSGAVVCFTGVVRAQSDSGREGVHAIDYEAWVERGYEVLSRICVEASNRWPDVKRLALLHRYGEVLLGEASVVVVASAPHRGEAFNAARFCIDVLKLSVPVWKTEHRGERTNIVRTETLISDVASAATGWDSANHHLQVTNARRN